MSQQTNMVTGNYLDPFDTQITAEETMPDAYEFGFQDGFSKGYADGLACGDWADKLGITKKIKPIAARLQDRIASEHEEFYETEQIEHAMRQWLETQIESLIEDAPELLFQPRFGHASNFRMTLWRIKCQDELKEKRATKIALAAVA